MLALSGQALEADLMLNQ
ncbi:MAG TPA: hypothetical protein DIC45_01295 [Comamonadaceae bacterium]|nr:hypothetical protein [Comamonadaceae bacterium]